jgi:hypothetical protein
MRAFRWRHPNPPRRPHLRPTFGRHARGERRGFRFVPFTGGTACGRRTETRLCHAPADSQPPGRRWAGNVRVLPPRSHAGPRTLDSPRPSPTRRCGPPGPRRRVEGNARRRRRTGGDDRGREARAAAHLEAQFVHARAHARATDRPAGRRDSERGALNLGMHVGQANRCSARARFHGGRRAAGPRASVMFTLIRLANDQTLENITGLGASLARSRGGAGRDNPRPRPRVGGDPHDRRPGPHGSVAPAARTPLARHLVLTTRCDLATAEAEGDLTVRRAASARASARRARASCPTPTPRRPRGTPFPPAP